MEKEGESGGGLSDGESTLSSFYGRETGGKKTTRLQSLL